MKKFFFFFIGFSICTLSTFSQGADIWYFGENAGLDFNTNPPTVIEGMKDVDGKIDIIMESAATITNSQGEFLFGINGKDIYNAKLEKKFVLPNGSDWDVVQGSQIIPVPGTTNQYYVVTVPMGTSACSSPEASYAKVTVDPNSTDGDNITIGPWLNFDHIDITGGQMILPKIDPITKQVLDEYWVVFHGRNTNEFHVYSMDQNGHSHEKTVSAGPVSYFDCTHPGGDVIAVFKANGCFNQFAYSQGGEISLFDFDAESGDINFQNSVGPIAETYGLEFSPSGNYVYASSGTFVSSPKVFKIPVSPGGTGSTLGSVENIGNTWGTIRGGSLQLGPDGKIYVTSFSSWSGTKRDNYLGTITDPDGAGLFDPKAILIPNSITGMGLPNIPPSLVFNRVNIWDETACGGDFSELSYTFSGLEQAAGDRLWQIFEGNATGVPVATSTEKYVDHYWSEAGTYAVTLEINDFYGNTYHDTLYKYVNEPYLINIDPVDSVYPNQTVSFSSSDYNADSYRWYDTQTSPDVLKTGATFDTILYDDEVCVWVEPDLELAGPFTAGHDEDAGYNPTGASEGVHEFNALKPIKIDGFTVTGISWLDEGTDEISIEIRLGSSVVAGPVFTTMNKLGDTYLTDLNLIVPQGNGYSIHITGGSYSPADMFWSDIKSIPGIISVTASNLLKDWQVYEMHPCYERKRVCAYSKDIATSSLDIDNSKFNIYPNPTNSNFTVFCPDNFEFTVLDVKGRIVKSGRANDSIDIIMKDEGIYFVLINQENQIFSAKKIVVNK